MSISHLVLHHFVWFLSLFFHLCCSFCLLLIRTYILFNHWISAKVIILLDFTKVYVKTLWTLLTWQSFCGLRSPHNFFTFFLCLFPLWPPLFYCVLLVEKQKIYKNKCIYFVRYTVGTIDISPVIELYTRRANCSNALSDAQSMLSDLIFFFYLTVRKWH